MTCSVSVLLVPGLPTTKTGMRLSTHTVVTNRFSVSASFIATPSPTSKRPAHLRWTVAPTVSNPCRSKSPS